MSFGKFGSSKESPLNNNKERITSSNILSPQPAASHCPNNHLPYQASIQKIFASPDSGKAVFWPPSNRATISRNFLTCRVLQTASETIARFHRYREDCLDCHRMHTPSPDNWLRRAQRSAGPILTEEFWNHSHEKNDKGTHWRYLSSFPMVPLECEIVEAHQFRLVRLATSPVLSRTLLGQHSEAAFDLFSFSNSFRLVSVDPPAANRYAVLARLPHLPH